MRNPLLSLALILFFSLSAWSEDDMSAEIKKGTTVPGAATPAAPSAKPEAGKKLDPSLRTKIRQAAPFWIDDSAHGAGIRINKDGTFSSESQGGGSTAGTWRAYKGELFISWSDGGEQYFYSAEVKKGVLLIKGKSAKKGRYAL